MKMFAALFSLVMILSVGQCNDFVVEKTFTGQDVTSEICYMGMPSKDSFSLLWARTARGAFRTQGYGANMFLPAETRFFTKHGVKFNVLEVTPSSLTLEQEIQD